MLMVKYNFIRITEYIHFIFITAVQLECPKVWCWPITAPAPTFSSSMWKGRRKQWPPVVTFLTFLTYDVVMTSFKSHCFESNIHCWNFVIVVELMVVELVCLADSFQETFICVLPFFHIYGLFSIMLFGFEKGAKLVTLPRFDPKSFITAVNQHEVIYNREILS